jgi:hypothetical protein
VVQLPRRRAAATKSRGTKPRSAAKRRNAAGTTGPGAQHRQRQVDGIGPSEFARAKAGTATPTARNRPRAEKSVTSAPSRAASSHSERRPAFSSAAGGLVSQPTDSVGAWLKAQVNRLLAGVRHTGDMLKNKIEEWMDTLADAVGDGGAGVNAALGGVRGLLTGKNPMWAAVKGLVSGLSGKAKVALVLLVTFGLLLGPVLLLVLLLALLVVALVAAVRAASQ